MQFVHGKSKFNNLESNKKKNYIPKETEEDLQSYVQPKSLFEITLYLSQPYCSA